MAISDLKPYPAYKDSGVPWLGRIPAHWDVARNGRLFARRNEPGTPDLPILEVSLKTGVRVRRFEGSGRKQVLSDATGYRRAGAGDIAYNMMRMWQGAVGVAPTDGLVSPAYIVARPLTGTEGKYYAYLFRTGAYMEEVDKYSRGIVKDRNRLYWEDFKQIQSILPPPEEQSAIVRLLDHVDRRVRRYIWANQRLVALLNQQIQTIIHHAVTRGLDPSVRLKPSGVDWLGNVPEHWNVVRNKAVCRVETGHTPSRKVAEYWVDCTIPWFTLADVHQIRNDRVKYVYQTRERLSELGLANSAARKLPAGTVILSRTASVGLSAILGCEMATSQDFMAWIPGRAVVGEYLLYVLRGMRSEFRRIMYGSTHNTIYMPMLHGFRMPLPPSHEQAAVVRFLDRETEHRDSAAERASGAISLLREYRTRLIVDVVSGKLDVRAAAAKLPYEPDEAAILDETGMAENDGEPEADPDPSTIDDDA